MIYIALSKFSHKNRKFIRGNQFDSKAIGFTHSDVLFLESRNKIAPLFTDSIGAAVEVSAQKEPVVEYVEPPVVEPPVVEPPVVEPPVVEAEIDFESMTKKELDIWAKENLELDLDRRKNKTAMIEEIKSKL